MREPSSRPLRSVVAIGLGILVNVIPALLVDQVLHVIEVYPPWGQPMFDPALNLLALSYRVALAVLGGYVTAAAAPSRAMRHVLILGVIGLVMSGLAAVATITTMELGPDWYPVSLAVIALPASWAGGRIRVGRRTASEGRV
jgi:hypothetical protein